MFHHTHLTFAMFSSETEQCWWCSTYKHLTAPTFQNPFMIRKHSNLVDAQCISLAFLFWAVIVTTCRKQHSRSFSD